MRKDTDKQVNITLSEENKENLSEYCDKNKMSRNAAMNRAVELLTLDKLRSKAPEQAAYIDEFEMVIDKILVFYRQAIERSLSADDRARAEVKGQLEGMATWSKTNEKLEAEKTELLKEKAKLEKTVAEQAEQISRINFELSAISYDAKEAEDLKKKYAALVQEKADLLAKHNEEIARLQAENFERILEVIKAGAK